MATMKESLARAAKLIAGADLVAATCHVSPDGDGLGSALALAHAARENGKSAVVSFGGHFVVPDTLGFLDLAPLVEPADFPAEPDVLVVFDAGDPGRLGELAANAAHAGSVVVVDHHLSTGDEFGDVQVVDSAAAASAQLAVDLLDALGWEISATAATCLLTGLVTDTGRFQYSATTGEVMRVAGRLLDAGVRPELIGQNVYESVPFGYLAASARVLSRAELDGELGFIWSWVDESDLEAAGVSMSDLDGLIDDLRIAREAHVAALLKETETGWKVSLRSRGRVDVAAIAGSYGGGGHHNAAGFTTPDSRESIISSIRTALS